MKNNTQMNMIWKNTLERSNKDLKIQCSSFSAYSFVYRLIVVEVEVHN